MAVEIFFRSSDTSSDPLQLLKLSCSLSVLSEQRAQPLAAISFCCFLTVTPKFTQKHKDITYVHCFISKKDDLWVSYTLISSALILTADPTEMLFVSYWNETVCIQI